MFAFSYKAKGEKIWSDSSSESLVTSSQTSGKRQGLATNISYSAYTAFLIEIEQIEQTGQRNGTASCVSL